MHAFKKLYKFILKINNHVENVGNPYVVFGIFGVITYPLYYLIWIYDTGFQTYENLWLRLIVVFLCIPLIFKEKWPKKYIKFLPIYWYITILYSLPFLFTFFVLKNNFSNTWILNATTVIVLSVLLLNRKLLVIILPLGIFLGIAVYWLTGDQIHLPSNFRDVLIVYLSVLIFGVLFAHRKEVTQQEKLQAMKLIGASIAHELRTPLQSLSFGADSFRQFFPKLLSGYKKAKQANLLDENDEMRASTISLLEGTPARMEREIRLSATMIGLLLANIKASVNAKSGESFLITTCVDEALENYPFKLRERELIEWVPIADFKVKGNMLSIMLILTNLIKNSLYYIAKANKGIISIWVENDGNKHHFLYFKDTSTGIPAKILPHIFDRFYSKREHGTGVGLSYCKMAIESLGGKISCTSIENEYTLFKLSFPVDH